MTNYDMKLTVNGTEHELAVEPRTLLVHALRDELGYTGTNVGCESSLCGACTVRLDGDAVKACTVLAVQADGATIETVEGLAEDGEFHPIQSGFQEEHGLQCGYCTPGMMMAATDLLAENPDPSREEIREGLEGNLCRCTGYQNIVNAVENAAEELHGGAVADGGCSADCAAGRPESGCDSGGGNVRWPGDGGDAE
ncbi:(2Fe-2S)-binding protein [Natrinema salifodinae]|uniref:Carbon-monoxide dehydrogenase small subunit n=1 Tax=Natrinema salifodinae TaxID=1202768 RepID=A0A1I0QS22_9EURY|nr:(2Fe-2S)-binding protein [Natrinema salifodinae]SEW30403.1 carbon-monoxide dehydrogenase small subunit [Natrinema salifodinae]